MNAFEEKALENLTGGDKEAIQFLKLWRVYLRSVDDIVDEGFLDAEHLNNALMQGGECFSTPFYRENAYLLQSAVINATALWELSCKWEREGELWKRQWADVLRHADVIVINTIVLICRGWDAVASDLPVFMEAAYLDHKIRRGIPQ